MMNLVDLQDKLKNFSQDQLIQQMQAPTGDIPQFLLLSEITRRQKMRTAYEGQAGQDETTVAQDMIAAGGMPAEFAGQMAGAMAPQTDVMANDAAMPQQEMMPEPVQGMAEGGIVALREGSVGRGPLSGSDIVVRNGRMFRRNPETGELVPLVGTAGGMSEAPPMMSIAPAAAFEPALTPPLADERTWGQRNVGDPLRDFFQPVGDSLRDMGQPVGDSLRGVFDAPSAPPTSINEISPVPGQVQSSPIATATSSPGFGMDVFTAPIDLGGSDVFPEPTSAEELRERGINPRSLTDRVSDRLGGVFSPMPDVDSAEFQALQRVNPELAAEILRRAQDAKGRRADAEAARSGEPVPEVKAPDDETTRPRARPSEDVDPTPPPAGPSGGGIASVAAGAAGVAPSSFEQELLDMMAAREKRAQQDKWLALAQFGLQLMSSKEPTFGGAIGEAGAPALDALRSSRESAEGDRLGMLNMLEQYRIGQAQLALQQQAMAARAASGSGGAATPFGELSAGQGRLLSQYDSEINRLSEVLSGATPGVTEAQRLDAAQRIEALSRERAQIVSGLSGVPFGAGGSSGATMFDVR